MKNLEDKFPLGTDRIVKAGGLKANEFGIMHLTYHNEEP